jgi:hypothetical protein
MTDWSTNSVVQQIKRQAPNKEIESALLFGAYNESSFGTDANTMNTIGNLDSNGYYSYGPYSMNAVGWLADVESEYGLTQTGAIKYAINPVTATAYATKLYSDSWTQGSGGTEMGSLGANYYGTVGARQIWDVNDPNAGYYSAVTAADVEHPGQLYNTGDYASVIAPIVKGTTPKGLYQTSPQAAAQLAALQKADRQTSNSSPDPTTVISPKGGGSFTNQMEQIMDPKVSGWSWLNPGDWGKNIGAYSVMVVVRALIAGAGLLMIFFGLSLIVQKSGIMGGGSGGGPEIVPIPV